MKSFLTLALAVVAVSGLASAAPACATGLDSTPAVGNSFSLTGSCTVGPYVFSNFSVFEAVGPFPGAGFGVNIFVDPLGGLDISYTGITAPTDFHFSFQATPGLSGIILQTGVGSTVSEGVCNNAFNIQSGSSPCGGTLINTTPLTATNGGIVGSSFTSIGTDFFYKDISGGSEVIQLVTPEPMTLSMLGAGLIGLGIFGRRRFKK